MKARATLADDPRWLARMLISPAIIYIAEGEIVEYASNCAVPIVHKAGDVAAERFGTSHWWQNTGSTTAVLISVDLFPVADKMDAHMM